MGKKELCDLIIAAYLEKHASKAIVTSFKKHADINEDNLDRYDKFLDILECSTKMAQLIGNVQLSFMTHICTLNGVSNTNESNFTCNQKSWKIRETVFTFELQLHNAEFISFWRDFFHVDNISKTSKL